MMPEGAAVLLAFVVICTLQALFLLLLICGTCAPMSKENTLKVSVRSRQNALAFLVGDPSVASSVALFFIAGRCLVALRLSPPIKMSPSDPPPTVSRNQSGQNAQTGPWSAICLQCLWQAIGVGEQNAHLLTERKWNRGEENQQKRSKIRSANNALNRRFLYYNRGER